VEEEALIFIESNTERVRVRQLFKRGEIVTVKRFITINLEKYVKMYESL
jgi:hypothetical protein